VNERPRCCRIAVEEAERAAVHVLAAHDVVARFEQLHDRVDAAGAAGEREAVATALERGDVALQRLARRIFAARVLVPLVLAERVLHIRRRQINRRHDRAGERLRALAGVDRPRREAGVEVFVVDARHADTRGEGRSGG
jgi:hypothetical protein